MRKCIAAECSTSVGSLYMESFRKLRCYCTNNLGCPSLSRRDVDHHVATSVFEASVTLRCEISRRDVILKYLCHVAT